MTTEDLLLPSDGSWLFIPLTTSSTMVFNNHGDDLLIRFGSTSTSSGFRLSPMDTIVCSESIYVRLTQKYSQSDGEIVRYSPISTVNVTR